MPKSGGIELYTPPPKLENTVLNKVYLTIDDSPSVHMGKKVDFLSTRNIPALFYAHGEHIVKHPDQIINAINNGFLIGNHSYSHRYFSKITLSECIDEIAQTEQLIKDCYQIAGKERPYKIIRLPFGDRGAGANAQEQQKVDSIQSFLKANKFKQFNFEKNSPYIDAYWDWDTKDNLFITQNNTLKT